MEIFSVLVVNSNLSLHEKLKWFFDAFDYDGDGVLDQGDLHLSIKGVILGDCKVR